MLIVDSGVMDPSYADIISSDFIKWKNSGCSGEEVQNTIAEHPDTCNIVLTRSPSGGLKDLVNFKVY